MKKRTIFVVGNSHTRALLRAAQKNDCPHHPLIAFDVHWLISERRASAGLPVGDMTVDDAVSAVRTLDANDLVVLSVVASATNRVALLKSTPPFTLANAADESGEDAVTIPEAAMYDFLVDFLGSSGLVRKIADETSAQLFHLAPPPPKGNTAHVLEKAQRALGEVEVNSPGLRARMWQLEMRALEHLCTGWGVKFIPVPPRTVTDDGLFLRPEYYADDVVHANPAYGKLVLHQLEDLALRMAAQA